MRDDAARVLYVLYRYPQRSQTFVRDEIHSLRAAGLTVGVVSLDEPERDADLAVWAGPYAEVARPSSRRAASDLMWWLSHHPLRTLQFVRALTQEPGRRSFGLRRVPTLARVLRGDGWSHVHTHFVWNTATLAAGIGILIDVPRSITVHAKDIYAQPPAVVRRRLTLFNAVVTVCHFNVGYMRGARMTPSTTQPRVISCGVAPDDRVPLEVPEFDIVTVGRLVAKKGVDVLLRAVARLRPHIRATVAIVGDGPERAALQTLSEELGLAAEVRFLGAMNHREALAAIRSGSVFCLASRATADADSDAMPVVIREAMTLGIPVIATRLAGIPESVDEAVGWLVEPDSPRALALGLRQALSDPDEARRRGLAGRARVSERWSFYRQARELAEMFHSVDV